MALLLDKSSRTMGFLFSYVGSVWPEVDRELVRWTGHLNRFEDGNLRDQARASILAKGFHCQGGAALALMDPPRSRQLIPVIVALQTISDYLDNLCDRAGILDEDAFATLHQAMMEAVDPRLPLSDHYQHYPLQGDGGYLESLVRQCREGISGLPSYHVVRSMIRSQVELYSGLQVRKHACPSRREALLVDWIAPRLGSYPGVHWWEYAAATGSTLGIFGLLVAASDPKLTPQRARRLQSAYFPWIGGLHILLDYLIDQEEDRQGGDLNFASYYLDARAAGDGLVRFLERSLVEAGRLERPWFHRALVRGLLVMYLTDPKAGRDEVAPIARELLTRGRAGRQAVVCRLLRRMGRVRSGDSTAEHPGDKDHHPA